MKCPVCNSKIVRNYYGDWLCSNLINGMYNHYFHSKTFDSESIFISDKYLFYLSSLKNEKYSVHVVKKRPDGKHIYVQFPGNFPNDPICYFPRDIFTNNTVKKLISKLDKIAVFS